ncbi:phosphotransferase, partial [Gottfriedia sp. NPDC056225]|uniref:phosphotransferase n=1 Tax=Gottfriedia sp. NPDC056225 TaxID=3345751 RepID=UPI0035E114C4
MDSKISEIVSKWDLSVQDVHIISKKVTIFSNLDGKKYVLKQKGSPIEIFKEHELLDHLHSKNISVQRPLLNKNGEDFCEYKKHYFSIYEYFEGEIITPKECLQNGNSPHLFGETIASLHMAMEKFRVDNE